MTAFCCSIGNAQIIYSKQKLSDRHNQWIIYQILLGLKYMHSAKCIHRDLKPSNVLINSNNHVKICDLGLARGVEESADAQYTEYVVTRWYRAPEVMVTATKYDYQIDVWAVGCILGELLERKKPLFPGTDYLDQLKWIISTIGTPTDQDLGDIGQAARNYIQGLGAQKRTKWTDRFKDANPDALDLLDKLLQFSPKRRITVEEALKHHYFKGLEKKPTFC